MVAAVWLSELVKTTPTTAAEVSKIGKRVVRMRAVYFIVGKNYSFNFKLGG